MGVSGAWQPVLSYSEALETQGATGELGSHVLPRDACEAHSDADRSFQCIYENLPALERMGSMTQERISGDQGTSVQAPGSVASHTSAKSDATDASWISGPSANAPEPRCFLSTSLLPVGKH